MGSGGISLRLRKRRRSSRPATHREMLLIFFILLKCMITSLDPNLLLRITSDLDGQRIFTKKDLGILVSICIAYEQLRETLAIIKALARSYTVEAWAGIRITRRGLSGGDSAGDLKPRKRRRFQSSRAIGFQYSHQGGRNQSSIILLPRLRCVRKGELKTVG